MRVHPARARLALGTALAAIAMMSVGAAGAEAKVVKLTGSTTFTPSDGAKQFLANAGVSVAPVGPATEANGAFTFPIVAGFGDTKTYNGLLVHSGGLRFSKGQRSTVLRRFVAVRAGKLAVLLAQIPGRGGGCRHIEQAIHRFAIRHPGYRNPLRKLKRRYPKAAQQVIKAIKRYCKQGRVIVLAKLKNLGKSVANGTATLTADLRLSAEGARLVNRLARHKVVKAGALLGSATSTVTRAG